MSEEIKKIPGQFSKKSLYETANEEEMKAIFDYAEGYKVYLDNSKTEREAVDYSVGMLRKNGFTEYKPGEALAAGDKKYFNNRGRCLYVISVGEENIEENGIRICAAHVDAPRLDLKQIPLYEDSEMSFLKTHYYGGIKKYQWTATPLSLHGRVVRADGSYVDIRIGEDEGDPVFYINDLLPHLGSKQSAKTLGTAIPGETLNILVGGIPYSEEEDGKASVKLNVLRILYEKYGITEEDFISAELSATPAYKARDIGFDRALIGSYGHDDRVCAYPALTAAIEAAGTSKHTIITVLADKEEIGSVCNTGMQSFILHDLIRWVSSALGADEAIVRMNSMCISSDVTAAFDPNFSEVYEKRNSAIVSCGTAMSKYTGSRGKSGTNDASAEYVGFIRRLFDENGVKWQTAELGKVDEGGGGTVAMYISKLNIDTIDIGVPVISMHAPYEVVSKADVYSTYKAIGAFYK